MSSSIFNSSPPKTPRRPIMDIVNDRLAERKSAIKMSAPTPTPASKLPQRTRSPLTLSTSGIQIQVPATQTAHTSPLKESHTPQVNHEGDSNGNVDTSTESSEAYTEFTVGDPKADLPPFDWNDFEVRYTSAIKAASDKEDDLLEEFQNLSEAFEIWADASSEHDNVRACKRLKTRERFVQLAENSLDEKKKHYNQVVQAFKSALELFE